MCELQDLPPWCNFFFLCSFGELTEWSSSCKEANICAGSMLSAVGTQPRWISTQKYSLDLLANGRNCTGMPSLGGSPVYCSVFGSESYPVDLCMPSLGGSPVYLQCIRIWVKSCRFMHAFIGWFTSVFAVYLQCIQFESYPVDLCFLCVWLVQTLGEIDEIVHAHLSASHQPSYRG